MRIAELEKSVAEKEQANVIIAESVHAASVTLEHYANQIAELTAPVTVDGKTPGQVAILAYYATVDGSHRDLSGQPSAIREGWEYAAKDVLRAHGGEVLRRVREAVMAIKCDDLGRMPQYAATYIIDDELARLGNSTPPSSAPNAIDEIDTHS